MDYFPAFHDLRGRAVLIVGGGEVAARKYALLASAGARVFLVAPALHPELETARNKAELMHMPEHYASRDLSAYTLVVAATDDATVNAQVAADAERAGRPVNVVDTPELCSFIVPAIVDRSPVQVAISTGGAAPVLARRLRSQIEALLPAGLGRLAELSARWRERVKRRFPALTARRRFWERLFDSPLVERLMQVEERAAEALFADALASAELPSRGEVSLVGAGPGDPELLTLKGLRLLQEADVVVYDRLVSKEVLALARRDAETLYVGKAKADHALPQEDINALLVRLAREGKRVCRLKGGDPFVFGRGGEELETLAEAGIAYQVAPGITAALGCAASSLIPLTHREHAQSLVYVTGHGKDGEVHPDWSLLASPRQTVVFYMGLSSLPRLVRELLAHGRAGDTPAALIENGTLPNERVVTGTLAELPQLALSAQFGGPVLIMVGEVVALRERLAPHRVADRDWRRVA
ncbi:MAG: uroporphyrinogen-III C-methyltransferase [Gammaproteobacteria bacterium]|nr:uroporphyrinogen-III C-methyltransferase [Gammaproteobacteria bacterium]